MNFIHNIYEQIVSDPVADFALHTAAITTLAAACGYGGTYFFSALKPPQAALYMGAVALISFVVYRALEQFKELSERPSFTYFISAVQLLQIPVVFYAMPNPLGLALTNAMKLEIVYVTAYFVAIPIFFHMAIKAWKDPSMNNISLAVGTMVTLVNGLRGFIKV